MIIINYNNYKIRTTEDSEWTTGKICVQFSTQNEQQSIANQLNSTQILPALNTLHYIADRTV